MRLRKILMTGTMITLAGFAISPSYSQDAPEGFVAAYELYASAKIELTAAQSTGGDVAAATEAALAAQASLQAMCTDAGIDDLSACLEQFIPADSRIPGDTDPIAMPEPVPAEEPVVEDEPAAEEVPAEEPVTEEAPAETEPVVEDEPAVTEEAPPAAEEPAVAEEAPVVEQAPAEPEPATEEEMQAEEPVMEEPAAEEPVTEEPAAEEPAAEEPVAEEPAGTDDVVEMLAPEGLAAAYETYVNALFAFDDAVSEGGDVQATGTAAADARAEVVAICETVGFDLAACLDAFIASGDRVEGDTEQVVIPEPGEDNVAVTTEDTPAEPIEVIEEDGEAVPAEEIAPLLDSAKDEAVEDQQAIEEGEEAPRERRLDGARSGSSFAAPLPESDSEAQAESVAAQPTESAIEESGTQVEASVVQERRREERVPDGAEIVASDDGGFRFVIRLGNNQLVLQNNDRPRLTQREDEVYIEELSRGRTRETIERPDGSSIVTIYDRRGDIIQRSRFTPEGREIVLIYADRDRFDRRWRDGRWRDPGDDLPPLRLRIPAREYILDAEEAEEDEIRRFLSHPPVEQVQELYSVDDVKRSSRLRDMVRRLEIGDLTFDTGKASISPNQISALSGIANAMLDMLEENPAETFLIEGHTDAVGSDISNLDLSDRRAETVAIALTQVFNVPPENLATQGYGERYLKINTDGDERRNRRVTIKRITPLVTPVAQR